MEPHAYKRALNDAILARLRARTTVEHAHTAVQRARTVVKEVRRSQADRLASR
jgi:hypothetical protein